MSAVAAVPAPIVAASEMAALRRFFRDCEWTGEIVEGGMGPGTPRMRATGRGTHREIQDGVWIVGDYEQEQFLMDGTFVLRWELHWVVGWDADAAMYRATHADNYGHAGVMCGKLDGDVLTFESAGDGPVRLRMTWQILANEQMRWSNESSIADGPYTLIEEYEYTFA